MRQRIIVVLATLAALSACGETPAQRAASGAGIGAGAALVAGASLPWGLAIGAGAGYFSR